MKKSDTGLGKEVRVTRNANAQLHTALFTQENLAVNHTAKPNSVTPLQQLSAQQASWQITSCDHERANNPAPGSPRISRDQTLRCRLSVSRRRPMWFCWLRALRTADKASAAQSPELSRLGTWVEIHQNICELDLGLIEGLISSPLVFIRRRNGGKPGGFLTAGTAPIQAPVPSNWVRLDWSRQPALYITTLSGALIYSRSL